MHEKRPDIEHENGKGNLVLVKVVFGLDYRRFLNQMFLLFLKANRSTSFIII